MRAGLYIRRKYRSLLVDRFLDDPGVRVAGVAQAVAHGLRPGAVRVIAHADLVQTLDVLDVDAGAGIRRADLVGDVVGVILVRTRDDLDAVTVYYAAGIGGGDAGGRFGGLGFDLARRGGRELAAGSELVYLLADVLIGEKI